ncbi:MAG TPA: hypothetical protein VGU25_04915 [Acidobacteriaceae bacterium]|nr:hypothetical protein [Acidobacteriaceae bacterium]
MRKLLILAGAIVLVGWQANAQTQTVSGPAAEQQQLAANTSAASAPAPAAEAAPAASAAADVPPLKVRDVPEAKSKKSKKDTYTGPNTIVELPPTPMLDEQGMQRLDPDGKPMWNAPVKQQRDKKGHPLFDENGKPVFQTKNDLGYDEHGKKIKVQKEKEPKKVPVSVARGTLTVDGMTGKAALNYEISDLKYIYLYAPGIGVAVISNEPFPGAVEQKNAFTNNTLTVTIGEHTLQLASDKNLLGKKPESAYVMMDRQFTLPSRFPVMGYGTVRKAPYQWPGARANTKLADDDAPPPPADLLPTQLLSPCPAGQMRKPAPPVLPGQTAPAQPCVPIKAATQTASSANPIAKDAATAGDAAKN